MSFSPPLKIARLPVRDDDVLVYGTGVLYKGSLDEKQRCGPGVLTFPDGSVYEGLFLNNKRNGDGESLHAGRMLRCESLIPAVIDDLVYLTQPCRF